MPLRFERTSTLSRSGRIPARDRDLLVEVLVIAKAVAQFALRPGGERRKVQALLLALRLTLELQHRRTVHDIIRARRTHQRQVHPKAGGLGGRTDA